MLSLPTAEPSARSLDEGDPSDDRAPSCDVILGYPTSVQDPTSVHVSDPTLRSHIGDYCKTWVQISQLCGAVSLACAAGRWELIRVAGWASLMHACKPPPRKAFEQVIVLGGFSVLRIVTPPLSAQDRSYVMVNLADSDRAGNLVEWCVCALRVLRV